MERVILLADMNSFFASCHQAVQPELQGKPVIVAGGSERRHGIVLSASYEARAFGVKTGMVNGEARALCSAATVWVRPDFELYSTTSQKIHRIMLDFTPAVEPFSIDEAFLDVSASQQLFGDGETIARQLKERIKKEEGISCSIGIGPNKLLAKMAAEMQKPDGLTLLRYEDVPERLWTLPVRELLGVGRRTARKLADMGIETIGELAAYPTDVLRRRFGIIGQVLSDSANGKDQSPVDARAAQTVKSISHQITLPYDYRKFGDIALVLLELADLVSSRARLRCLKGRTVSLSVRGADLEGLHRTRTLPYLTDEAEEIQRVALFLLQKHWPAAEGIRLLGVGLGQLVQGVPDQLTIFHMRPEATGLPHVLDQIRKKHGITAIVRAASMNEASILLQKNNTKNSF